MPQFPSSRSVIRRQGLHLECAILLHILYRGGIKHPSMSACIPPPTQLPRPSIKAEHKIAGSGGQGCHREPGFAIEVAPGPALPRNPSASRRNRQQRAPRCKICPLPRHLYAESRWKSEYSPCRAHHPTDQRDSAPICAVDLPAQRVHRRKRRAQRGAR
ncbi:hypothetical protein HYPSUDRAFT_1007069 [Hypholoma sublateritium FD-334 SS-4]|uniref:Uncharacterized protein n=1 Tax=Hypholoma sublateritium (strain FD-334 SS-4) TaxID=945553 RepID=A0A0D2PBH3_HYPSF|nr:hypothetical protein HYPSUDRAFT_1007069 [Hypholoma sublateritium FD-334 SS-4]